MKQWLVLMIITIMGLSSCSRSTANFQENNWASPLSDDLDIRFQQLFFESLESPTIENTPLAASYDIKRSSGSGIVPEIHHFSQRYPEHGLEEGAFCILEPSKSSLVVGLEKLAVRSIYDFTYKPTENGGETMFLSFSMEIEQHDYELCDLTLVCDTGDLLNTPNLKIPLDLENETIYIDLTKVAKIVGNVKDIPFALQGTLVNDKEELDFKMNF